MASNLFKKYLWLADTIRRFGPISLAEIRSRWSRSSLSDGTPLAVRTFHAHRNAVEDLFDICIACDARTDRYYIENCEDLNSRNISNWLLDSFAVSQTLREASVLHDRVLVEEIPSAKGLLPELLDAMRENRQVVVTYQPFTDDEPFDVRLRPLFVKLCDRRWYLYADKPSDAKIKLYALDRMQNLRITDERFGLPAGFDPSGYLADAFGVTMYDDIKPCTIRVRASGVGAKYLRTLPLHASQREVTTGEGYAIFEYRVAPTPEFYQSMLNCHLSFEIISPRHVRSKMARIIEGLADIYHSGAGKVIFLDFDGVLNTERHIAALRKQHKPLSDKYGYLFDPESVANLGRIVERTGAVVVIISSWCMEGWKRMKSLWQDRALPGNLCGMIGGGQDNCCDVSLPLDPMGAGAVPLAGKGAGIEAWLGKNAPAGCRYVILDDEQDFYIQQMSHHIHIDPHDGITRVDAERAIDMLNTDTDEDLD